MEVLTGNLGLPAPAPHKLTYCKSGAPLKKKVSTVWRSEAGERGLVAVVFLSSLSNTNTLPTSALLASSRTDKRKVTTGFWRRLARHNIYLHQLLQSDAYVL